MGKPPTQSIHGRILAVQEQRFRLLAQTGQGLLLTLAKNAPIDPADLARWCDAGILVTVDCSGTANAADGIAHFVRPLDG